MGPNQLYPQPERTPPIWATKRGFTRELVRQMEEDLSTGLHWRPR
jgi:hypothetical protein